MGRKNPGAAGRTAPINPTRPNVFAKKIICTKKSVCNFSNAPHRILRALKGEKKRGDSHL